MPFVNVTTVGSLGPGAAPLLAQVSPGAPQGTTQFTSYAPAEIGYGPGWSESFVIGAPPRQGGSVSGSQTPAAAVGGSGGGGSFVDEEGGFDVSVGSQASAGFNAADLTWLALIAGAWLLLRKK